MTPRLSSSRVFTPEQLAAKRERQRKWYEVNRERILARDAARHREAKARRPSTRLDIECAIARGLSVPQIVLSLGVTAKRVHDTWDYLDECAGVAS